MIEIKRENSSKKNIKVINLVTLLTSADVCLF